MAVESENVERMMRWFAVGSDEKSANSSAQTLVEQLAALAFQSESEWPNNGDRADTYRDSLREWFADDSARETVFVKLTAENAEADAFIDWFLPVVREWEKRAAQNEAGKARDDGTLTGYRNENCDGTPGTEFYRFVEATGEYLYAEHEKSEHWASYEQRRYTERQRDDNYGLDYRFDRKNRVYEWYDEALATWNDQTWADLHAARHHDSVEKPAVEEAAEWDENWGMFYRVGPGGVYRFADAVIPGDKSSGCGDEWFTHEQVLMRKAQAEEEEVPAPKTEAGEVADPALVGQLAEDLDEMLPAFTEYVQELLKEEFGSLTPEDAAKALADALGSWKSGQSA